MAIVWQEHARDHRLRRDGLTDWGMFVSLFACFMKDAVRTLKIDKGAKQYVFKCLASPTYGFAADAQRARHGHAVHPTLVLQALSRQGQDLWGSEQAQRSDRTKRSRKE